MTDGVYKSLEDMHKDSPSYDPMQDLVRRIQRAEKSEVAFDSIARVVLTQIEQEHRETYLKNAKVDVCSSLAVQCRKRDDMTLIVHKFKETTA